MCVVLFMEYILEDYKRLNLNLTATNEEIKQAYKKLSIQCHPDKCKKDSTEFILLTQSYKRVLNNNKMLINFYIHLSFYVQWFKKSIKTENIQIFLNVTLNELYTNTIKKIEYLRLNHHFIKINEILYLELVGYKTFYLLEEHGDYNMFTKNFSSLEIHLSIEEHDTIKINGVLNRFDLSMTVPITLYEYYFGISCNINYLNEEMLITHNFVPYNDGFIQEFENYGLEDEHGVRHKLYVIYDVDLKRHNMQPIENFRTDLKILFECKDEF